MMKLANHKRIALFSPKTRWKVGSIVSRSRSVSLTSKTISGRPAMLLDSSHSQVRPKEVASAAGYGADCVANNFDNSCWSGNARGVIDMMRPYRRLHPLRHVALRLRDDHSIVLGNQKPTLNVSPKRAPDRNSDAAQ